MVHGYNCYGEAAGVDVIKPIGVLDSGVGGLSLLRAIQAELPQENLLYVADSLHAPYGDKSPAWISARSAQIISFLVGQQCKAVVIACNTITAVAVSELRDSFAIPIIAIEPAIKPAAIMTRSGVIAVMATTRTLHSESLQRLRQRYAAGVEVLFVPCPGLADKVESVDLDSSEVEQLLRSLLTPALDKGVDTLVLGCTHYPFLLDSIQRVVGPDVQIIDPSAAVAAEVGRRLQALDLLSTQQTPGILAFCSSAAQDKARSIMSSLLGQPLSVAALPG
ncbi:MAG: glutamate racemase [Pseudomonadales bacterium RIFCSPLOWO2_02_FULL_63_210]|nr:MAG: glutamate racemase [Pseudomonadales bacterium RIFCSPLOWO2_02_FULL_63_210]